MCRVMLFDTFISEIAEATSTSAQLGQDLSIGAAGNKVPSFSARR